MTTTVPRPTSQIVHPLEPLTGAEIERAVSILRAERTLGERVLFASVTLREPSKHAVRAYQAGDSVTREALIILLDNTEAKTYEAVISLDDNRVISWTHIPGVQPTVMPEELLPCGDVVISNPEWQAAMRKRGITDFSLCMIEPWSAGNFGYAHEEGLRLTRALTWVRRFPNDNGYARPVENVIALVDLNKMEVLSVWDGGVVPLPDQDGNYLPEFVGPLRTDLKPIEIHQPQGTSFEVDGHEISWQSWKMRIGFTPREGLVLYSVSYNDQGRERPILHRASVSDMVVPYGDPRPMYYIRNAFDVGEFGVGQLANSLELGCDCLGEIRYLDAVMNDGLGRARTIRNAICIHEEDYGILWKHYDWRLDHAETRRSRRLVVSFIATVGNYEYGFYWYFYQDGNIQFEVKLTGIMSNGTVLEGEKPKWGEIVAPQLYGPIHQHFFSMRMDMDVDGGTNSVYEINTVADGPGPENPHHNAFHAEATLLASESEAQRIINPLSGRFWKIVNPNSINRLGNPVAYKLHPGENVLPFATEEAAVIKRAGFMTKHLWVTKYDPSEQYATGDYPNQHPGGAGLPAYVADDGNVENTDVVVWYTIGAHHIVRPEEWPVMPVAHIGFMLKPVGFFDRNPALDVAPSTRSHSSNGTNGTNGSNGASCH